nr:hypothetical protein [Tanacetum cinerariifolium]
MLAPSGGVIDPLPSLFGEEVLIFCLRVRYLRCLFVKQVLSGKPGRSVWMRPRVYSCIMFRHSSELMGIPLLFFILIHLIHISYDSCLAALGWMLEEINVTWANLEKKRKRLWICTKIHQEVLISERGDGIAGMGGISGRVRVCGFGLAGSVWMHPMYFVPLSSGEWLHSSELVVIHLLFLILIHLIRISRASFLAGNKQ